jgi:hypothetical protein
VHHQAVKHCVKPYKKTGSSHERSLVMQAKGSKPVCYPTKFQTKHTLVQTVQGPIPTSYNSSSSKVLLGLLGAPTTHQRRKQQQRWELEKDIRPSGTQPRSERPQAQMRLRRRVAS